MVRGVHALQHRPRPLRVCTGSSTIRKRSRSGGDSETDGCSREAASLRAKDTKKKAANQFTS